jgi:predicted nucleic acid-binding protein
LTERVGPCVIDASAVLPVIASDTSSVRATRWFEAARDSLEDCLTVDLFDAECANALWKRVRWVPWPIDEAEVALDRVLALPFRRVAVGAIVGDALQLAVRLGLSVYDACYVALALACHLPLVTADRRLAQAARTAGCDALCLTEEPAAP